MKKDQRIINVQGDAAFDKAQIHKHTHNNAPHSGNSTHTRIVQKFSKSLLSKLNDENLRYFNGDFSASISDIKNQLGRNSGNEELLSHLEDLQDEFAQATPKKSRIKASWEYIKNQLATLNNLNGAVSLIEKADKGIRIILSLL